VCSSDLGEPCERLSVLPNAVDVARFAAGNGTRMRRALGIASDVFLIGCVARLEPIKGVAVLLHAFARLCTRGRRAQLVIVGGGSEEGALRGRVARWGLGDRVVLAGALPRSEIPDLLAALDVFVLPSLHEGFGIALIEAMAAGRAVVASRVDGIPELVRHGETGLLVPAGDPEALAGALDLLLARPTFALSLGRAAQAEAQARYEMASYVSQLEALYHQLLATRRDALACGVPSGAER
jgi:glycosyltransferase involved in cell wall biosynthesis